MDNYFWLVVVPNLECFFGTLGVIGLVFCVVCSAIYISMKLEAYDEEDEDKARKFAKSIIKVFSVSMTMFFITCFIPTKKDMIQLKIISVVSELKGVDKIPQKLVDRLNYFLDQDSK